MNSWFPPAASSVAGDVDAVYAFIFWVCAVFFVIIVAATVLFVWRYRARKWTAPQPSSAHNTKLEILWSGIPVLLVIVMFWVSTKVWLDMTEAQAAEGVQEVNVTAQKWSWSFEHSGGKVSADLHVVLGVPAKLIINATDVLHSLYIPAFRLKQDAVPGRYTRMTFTATKAGEFRIYCAEYCGTNHSQMVSKVIVHATQAEYDAWRSGDADANLPPEERGEKLFTDRGCAGCHSVDGTRRVGPSLKGLFGRTEQLEGGGSVTVDENYIRESIVEPRAKTVLGFPPVMPPAALSDAEFAALIAYIKSLH